MRIFFDLALGTSIAADNQVRPLDDLPAGGLVDELRREDHLITAKHTLTHWPQELYLTDAVIDRDNRETWDEKRPAASGSRRRGR